MGDRGYEGDSGYLAHLGTTAGTGRWDLGPRESDRWGAAPAASTGTDRAIDRGTDDAAASVARRLQSRLDRHLWLLERLQAEQPYPGSSGLTELQDTARRMRRDTESLLLLSGHEPGVPSSGPRRLADLVADAAAAAEEPRRVEVRHAPGAVVSPSAAAEFVHVLAELIDHVTAVYPDARIELVSHLEPMTGARAGATVDVLVDGAARHDPDGLGGLRAAAAEQLARCSRHGIALRRPPGGPPPTGSGLVASVHCPPAAVTVDEPPPPARPDTRVNGNGLPPYDYGIGGGLGGGIWGGNGNGSSNGNGNTGGWNANGNGASGGTGGVDTSGSWNSNGNGTSGGVDTSGSWNANGNGTSGGSRGVDTSGSWNANGNGTGGGSRGVDTSGSWNANGNGTGGGTGGVDTSGSWNANGNGTGGGSRGVDTSGSWNANGNGTGGVNTGDIWGGNGTSTGAGTGGAGGGGLWGGNGSTAPQTGAGTGTGGVDSGGLWGRNGSSAGTGTGSVDSGGLWGGNGTSAGSGTGGAGGGGLWGGNGSSAGTRTGGVDSGGLWGGSGTVSSTGSGTVTGGVNGGVNGGGVNGTDIWGGNGIGGTGVGNARTAAGAGGSTTEHVNGAARPPRSFDEPPAYTPSSSSSSQVDELFGPLLDLPLEPIDDRYATPIFEAIASAWFREDAAGGAPGRPQDWETPQDDEWRAAAARAARPDPEPTTTASGLPRRSPGDRLVPPPRRSERSGQHASQRRGAQHSSENVTSPPERVPDRVRDRLSTYQRGLREGRHRASDADSDDW